MCAGNAMPAAVSVSEIWSNKGGKWQGQFYQETPISN
jgi:hypothetical protein